VVRDQEQAAEKDPPRRKYTPPRVTDYGDIGVLTEGGAASTMSDAGMNSMFT
jgi:hypothetical protein